MCQYKELYLRLDDAEKLRRYVQSATSKHHALATLDKAKGRSKHWEWKAKEGVKRISSMEKEIDKAQKEA